MRFEWETSFSSQLGGALHLLMRPTNHTNQSTHPHFLFIKNMKMGGGERLEDAFGYSFCICHSPDGARGA